MSSMQIEIKKLKDIVSISLGYSFRGKIENDERGNISVVNAKDIKDNFIISNKIELIKINHPEYQDRLIREGDILLSNRGYFKASVFDLDKNTIGASSIYILKLKSDIILSEYLAIWINSRYGQNKINKNTTGSMIKTILRSDLENLKIDIPKLKEQEKIIELYKNKIELKKKLEEKEKIIENIFQGALSKIINKK